MDRSPVVGWKIVSNDRWALPAISEPDPLPSLTPGLHRPLSPRSGHSASLRWTAAVRHQEMVQVGLSDYVNVSNREYLHRSDPGQKLPVKFEDGLCDFWSEATSRKLQVIKAPRHW